jgi:hypothetical protein
MITRQRRSSAGPGRLVYATDVDCIRGDGADDPIGPRMSAAERRDTRPQSCLVDRLVLNLRAAAKHGTEIHQVNGWSRKPQQGLQANTSAPSSPHLELSVPAQPTSGITESGARGHDWRMTVGSGALDVCGR